MKQMMFDDFGQLWKLVYPTNPEGHSSFVVKWADFDTGKKKKKKRDQSFTDTLLLFVNIIPDKYQ